jgi:hypothetical protein
MEHRDVLSEMLRRVAFGIDGDEQRLHLIGCGTELVHGETDGLQVGRADIRAVGEAEINQHQLAVEVTCAASLAGLIDKLERAADRLAIPHHRIHQLGGGALR